MVFPQPNIFQNRYKTPNIKMLISYKLETRALRMDLKVAVDRFKRATAYFYI